MPVTLELDPVITPPTVEAAVTVPVTLVLDPVITPPTVEAAVTVPTALMPPLDVKTLAVLLYNQVINGLPIGPTSIPPPLAAAELIALLA